MARIKSEDKRNAILTAATGVVAERGAGATTAAIAKSAGVSEGTIFTYFAHKDDLLNALYREIKMEIADAMMSDFPRRSSVRHRLQHVWDRYAMWGASNPEKHRALQQIGMWSGLTEASREAGMTPFLEIRQIYLEAVEQKLVRDLPEEYAGAAMSALQEMTIGFMQKAPGRSEHYRQMGFETLWAALMRKK